MELGINVLFAVGNMTQYRSSKWAKNPCRFSIALVRKPPCQLNNFVFGQLQKIGGRFSASKMHLSPPVAEAVFRSKAVVMLLLVYCSMYFPLFVGVLCLSLFFYALLVSILVLQSS